MLDLWMIVMSLASRLLAVGGAAIPLEEGGREESG
jgi:hypothetical protein